jgi:hypothetical protein
MGSRLLRLRTQMFGACCVVHNIMVLEGTEP